MKSIWHAFLVLLFLHLFAAGGFVGWLHSSGRLNQDRLNRLVALFSPTITAEEAALAEEEAEHERQRERARLIAREQSIANGPTTLNDLLEMELIQNEVAQARLDRQMQESDQLRNQMEAFRSEIEEQQSALASERDTFEQELLAYRDKVQSEDFQQAVRTMQLLEATQIKDIFQELLDDNRPEDVIDYLAAMNQRKAAAVIAEFSEPEEADEALLLIEGLRLRRLELAEAQGGAM